MYYVKAIFRLVFLKLYRIYFRRGLKNHDFTIISSNCWGGDLYRDLKIEYNTPTAGLFFFAPCFVKLASNLSYYASANFSEVKESKYNKANCDRKKHNNFYPIGKFEDGTEIHFLHYSTFDTAKEKWDRRCKRINYKNLFFAFSERDAFEINLLDKYLSEEVPGKKIFFSTKKYYEDKRIVNLEKYVHLNEVPGADVIKIQVILKFNIKKWLKE